MIAERLEREAESVVSAYFDALKAGRRETAISADGGFDEVVLTDHGMRLKAADALLDRALGKARQSVDVAHSGGLSIEALFVQDPLAGTHTDLPEEAN